MALRIACDLDGTLADMDGALQREAERLFGREVAPASLTRAEEDQLWAHVRTLENFWTTLAEVEAGAVARLAATASLHGWEVIFVTQRPATEGETTQLQTQRWLDAHGFEYPSVFVMTGSRGKLADALALHAVIDDRPENCLDVVTDSKARPILIWREAHPAPPATRRLGITTATSFADAMEHLQRMMAAPPSTLAGRLRRAIGL